MACHSCHSAFRKPDLLQVARHSCHSAFRKSDLLEVAAKPRHPSHPAFRKSDLLEVASWSLSLVEVTSRYLTSWVAHRP